MPFNPSDSILGNGVSGQVTVAYTTGSTSWNIVTQSLPGLATRGTFPNTLNANSIQAQSFDYTWPYRGGKNLPTAGTHSKVPYGVLGVSDVGVVFFSPNAGISTTGLNGTTWTVNFVEAGIFGEDSGSGSPNQAGIYHYVDSRFIQNDSWGAISSGYVGPDGHSKILGWALDGYPIYGPYGYSNPLSSASTATRMVSGYRATSKANRPVARTLVVNGTVTSATSFLVYSVSGVVPGMTISGNSITTATKITKISGANIYTNVPVSIGTGEVVNAFFDVGTLVEDWDYSEVRATLDLYNGRFCVTPEYPLGTYAYFATQDTNNKPTFPYLVGPYFYGSLIIDSNNSSLSSLTASAGTFSPTFNSTVTNYLLTVGNLTTSLTFTPVSANINSVIAFNTVTVTSGSTTPTIQLPVGYTTSTFKVTSQYKTTSTYTVTINRVKSPDNTLKSLSIDAGILFPYFRSTVTNYSVTVDTAIDRLGITPIVSNQYASITINGNTATSGLVYFDDLVYGRNVETIVVTAQDASTQTYTINVSRLSNIPLLSNLSVSVGSYSPSFDSKTFFYTEFVANTITSIRVNATSVDTAATIYVNGVRAQSGVLSQPVSLKLGVNAVDITVISSDQTNTQYYRLTVNRGFSSTATLVSLLLSSGTLSPSFSSTITNYIATVTNNITSITVTPTASQEYSYVVVNDRNVPPGRQSEPINLLVGNNNVVIAVTAPDNVTQNIYNLVVRRLGSSNSRLANLVTDAVITPAFNSSIVNYSADVGYTISSLKITPTVEESNATVTVNNISVLSGQSSGSIPLSIGTNTIRTVVLAQDGITTSTYKLTVNRSANYDASLSNIDISSGVLYQIPSLQQGFSRDVNTYTSFASHFTPSTDIFVVANDVGAKLKINGLPVLSGSTTTVPLDGYNRLNTLTNKLEWFGSNKINITCTAADPRYVNTVELNISRVGSTISTLSNLVSNVGTLTPPFSFEITDYLISVPYTFTTPFQFKPFLTDPTSAVSINNVDVASGVFSDPIKIPVGTTRIPIVVRSSSGDTFTYYSVLIARAAEGLSTATTLTSIELSTGSYYPAFNPSFPVYNVNYTYDVTSIKIKPFKSFTRSTIKVNGSDVTSGEFSQAIPVPVGSSVANIEVTAEDLVTKQNYYINLTRTGSADSYLKNLYVNSGFLEPSFNKDITQYVVHVPNTTNTIAVKPFIDNVQAQVSINNLGIVPGNWSFPITVQTGSNIIKLVVLAGDLISRTIYQITFIKEAEHYTAPVVAPTQPVPVPVWTTPPGFIYTATELVYSSRIINAKGNNVSYRVISGSLPTGMSLSTSSGYITGIPASVYQTLTSTFVVRAQNTYGVADRKFSIDVDGSTPPVIVTPGPKPAIGPSGERYLINGQFVDFQFTATYDVLAPGKPIVFYIEDGDGQLPPGLTLSQTGHLYGQVQDSLTLFYRAGSNGAYDEEGYDINPYEHESQQAFGVSGRYVNKVYKFFLTAANGSAKVKAEYEIDVNDPTTLISAGFYPVAPQWMTPSDLGSVRSGTYQIIQLETYDCDPGAGTITYDWNIVNQNNFDILPPGLSLNPVSGVLSGRIQYSPTYSTPYTFKVRVSKHNVLNNKTQYRDKTFTLTILGAVLSKMSWVTDTIVGTLNPGEQSELSIKSVHEDTTLKITYALQSGALPPGLTFTTDGAIQGKANYGTPPGPYTITVKATDSNASSQLTKTFKIIVSAYTGARYTQILLQPLLSNTVRDTFSTFITDQHVFDPNLLYRPYDPAFGAQSKIEFTLEYGIEQLNLGDYVAAMQDYFSRRKLYFGNLKSAFALDNMGNKTYEVVYVELTDNMVNELGQTVSESVAYDHTTLYPNSIDNMRGALELIADADEYLLPKFMRTVQDSSGIPLGRILCMPLCYCLPGNSQTIIRRIEAYGIDFKTINFDVDRLIVLNTLDNSVAKYLLFPNREV
jgi:Cadherin-like beta sandwich domain/YHYH protein/Putative Ig domain